MYSKANISYFLKKIIFLLQIWASNNVTLLSLSKYTIKKYQEGFFLMLLLMGKCKNNIPSIA